MVYTCGEIWTRTLRAHDAAARADARPVEQRPVDPHGHSSTTHASHGRRAGDARVFARVYSYASRVFEHLKKPEPSSSCWLNRLKPPRADAWHSLFEAVGSRATLLKSDCQSCSWNYPIPPAETAAGSSPQPKLPSGRKFKGHIPMPRTALRRKENLFAVFSLLQRKKRPRN